MARERRSVRSKKQRLCESTHAATASAARNDERDIAEACREFAVVVHQLEQLHIPSEARAACSSLRVSIAIFVRELSKCANIAAP